MANRGFQPKVKSKVRDKLPTVRFLRPWRGYPVGATIKPPGVLRDVLTRQDKLKGPIAEVVEDKPEPEEQPAVKKTTAKKKVAKKTSGDKET